MESLCYDGTNWRIVGGEQDSGWLALSLGTGIVGTLGAVTASVRLQGDRAQCRGRLNAPSSGSIPITWATMPTGIRPLTGTISLKGQRYASATGVQSPIYLGVTTAGLLQPNTGNPGVSWANSDSIELDDIGFDIY